MFMYQIDKEKAKEILTSELNYSSAGAESFLKNFPSIHPELEEAVKSWLENRTFEDVDIYGIGINETMNIQRYHFLTAVRELNFILDNKDDEEKRERLVSHLKARTPKL